MNKPNILTGTDKYKFSQYLAREKMNNKIIIIKIVILTLLFNFGCSRSTTENSVQELRLELQQLGNSDEDGAEEFNPNKLSELIDQNIELKSEILKLQEVIGSSMLGKVSFKAGSTVVFEI